MKAFLKSQFFKSMKHVTNHLEYLNKQSTLFSGINDVALNDAQTAALNSEATKWWFVFGLNEEDAARLEIDRDYMKTLVESKKGDWAEAYNIPAEKLHVFASFHPTAHHPHLHVVLFGETGSDGYVVKQKGQTLGAAFKRCREKTKSSITNEIFKSDMQPVYKNKSDARNQVGAQLEKALQEIGKSQHPINKEWVKDLKAIGEQLQGLGGKHVYGYLPPAQKRQVDAFLERVFTEDPILAQALTSYKSSQRKIITELYVKKAPTIADKMGAFNEAFFSPKKGEDTTRHNLVIKAAEQLVGNTPANEETPGKTRLAALEQLSFAMDAADSERYKNNADSVTVQQDIVNENSDKALVARNFQARDDSALLATGLDKEQFSLLVRNVKHGLEQAMKTDAKLRTRFGEQLLALQAMLSPNAATPPFFKLSKEQQEMVTSTVASLLEQPVVRQNMQHFLASVGQRVSAEKMDAVYTALQQGDTAAGMQYFVLEYAKHATPEQPVDMALPCKRQLEYAVLCTMDKVLCARINAKSEETEQLVKQIYAKRPLLTQEQREKMPVKSYKKLSMADRMAFDKWYANLVAMQSGNPELNQSLQERNNLENLKPEEHRQPYQAQGNEKLKDLALKRFWEHYVAPQKQLVPHQTNYKDKSPAAALRRLLFLLGRSCAEQQKAAERQNHRPVPKHLKFKNRKKRLTPKERLNSIDR